jgi:nicotinate dehydrogenase subunit B
LVANSPIVGEVPEDVTLARPTPTVPDSPAGPAARDIVTGRAEFAGDVRLPRMVHGAVLHPAIHGARLEKIDQAAALSLPGVIAVVRDETITGVVADREDQARAALAALRPVWARSPTMPSTSTDVVLRSDPGTRAALDSAPKKVRARYFTPHVAGSPLGPSVGLVDIQLDHALVYATTQVPFRLRDAVAEIAGLPVERVHFRPRPMSGGFGRHGASDAAIEAARLSKAVGRPVRVQWGRADELRAGPNRPEMTAEIEAALDDAGRITAWRSNIHTNPYSYDAGGGGSRLRSGHGANPAWSAPEQMLAMMAGRNAIPSYDLGLAEVALHVTPGRVRTGALRSLGASPNVFAIESCMDELAHAAGQDPIAFRLAHVVDPRLRKVLVTVRERSGWSESHRPGLGVACVAYRQTYVAEVVEVAVARGRVSVERVWCAVDPGHVVHPDGARNQVEGAVQMAASWTLFEELPHHDDEVTGLSWADYPIATCQDAPRAIDVVFTGDDTTAPTGLGEPPAVPIAAAIANAICDATGARVRELPIRPQAIERALIEGVRPRQE